MYFYITVLPLFLKLKKMKYSKEKIQQFANEYAAGKSLMELSKLHLIPYEYLREITKPFIIKRAGRERLSRNTHDTFLQRIKIVNGCWEWQHRLNNKGYGEFCINNIHWIASRYSYNHYKGDVTDKHVCHSCDNPKCVNPAHLFLGDYKTNTLDCLVKGRKPTKLKKADIFEIRNLIKSGKSCSSISKIYKVNETTIKAIKTGRTWGWLK